MAPYRGLCGTHQRRRGRHRRGHPARRHLHLRRRRGPPAARSLGSGKAAATATRPLRPHRCRRTAASSCSKTRTHRACRCLVRAAMAGGTPRLCPRQARTRSRLFTTALKRLAAAVNAPTTPAAGRAAIASTRATWRGTATTSCSPRLGAGTARAPRHCHRRPRCHRQPRPRRHRYHQPRCRRPRRHPVERYSPPRPRWGKLWARWLVSRR